MTESKWSEAVRRVKAEAQRTIRMSFELLTIDKPLLSSA